LRDWSVVTTESLRVPLVGDDTDDARVAAVFAKGHELSGRSPNLYRMLAHSPELLEAWVAFAWPLRSESQTPRALRELVILQVAHHDGAEYERTHHEPMARAAGVTDEQIAALPSWRTAEPGTFSDVQRAVLALADAIAAGGDVDDTTWAAVAGHFDPRGLVELVLTASFYSCVSRVLKTLQVPLE
jgi:4-carboxymuconolactone decarboxylase